MSGLILNKKLTADGTDQSHTIGSMIRGISIYNNGDDPILVDFDHIIDGDSRYIPAGTSLDIAADFEVLHYQVASGSAATIYVTFIQNP